MPRFLILMVYCFFVVSQTAGAIPSHDLTKEGINPITMGQYEYMVTGRDVEFSEVTTRSDWSQTDYPYPGMDSSEKALWLRYQVINKTNDPNWVAVSYRDPNLKFTQFYFVNSKGQVESTTFPSSGSELRRWFDVIPGAFLHIAPGDSCVIYFKQYGGQRASNRFHLINDREYRKLSFSVHLSYGFYFGAAVLASVFCLMFLGAFRDKFYLAYFSYGLSFIFLGLINSGIWNFYFHSLSFISTELLQKIFEILPTLPGLWMAQIFISSKQYLPKIHKGMNSVMVFIGVAIIIRITFPMEQIFDQLLVSSCHILTLGYALSGCWLRFRQGDKGSILFFGSWAVLGITVIIWACTMLRIIAENFWLIYAPFWGQLSEFVILTIATIHRIYVLQKAQISAQLTEKHNEDLNLLLRVICHDLVNPLSVIEGLASINIMRQKKGEPPKPEHWQKIKQCVKQQNSIIQHIRIMQSLRDQKKDVILIPVSLSQSLQEACLMLEERMSAKKLTYQMDIEALNNVAVIAEPSSLVHQVLANVLSNAIKFSFPGDALSIAGGVVEDFVWIEIRDRGIGMPSEILQNLFLPKVSTTRKGTEGEAGTGFGMPVVKAYMDRFCGSITVKSINKEDNPVEHGSSIRLQFQKAKEALG